jgi:hypothetical protein
MVLNIVFLSVIPIFGNCMSDSPTKFINKIKNSKKTAPELTFFMMLYGQQGVFFLIGGSSRLLPQFLRVGSAMMCRTIVVLHYCRRSVNYLNHWLTDTCTRTWKISWRIFNTALFRAGRLSQIFSNTLLLVWSQLRMGVRWIQSTQTFLRPLIRSSFAVG